MDETIQLEPIFEQAYLERLELENREMRSLLNSALGDAHYFGAEESAKDTLDAIREWLTDHPHIPERLCQQIRAEQEQEGGVGNE